MDNQNCDWIFMFLLHFRKRTHCFRFSSFLVVSFTCTRWNWSFNLACRATVIRISYWTLVAAVAWSRGKQLFKNLCYCQHTSFLSCIIYNSLILTLQCVTDSSHNSVPGSSKSCVCVCSLLGHDKSIGSSLYINIGNQFSLLARTGWAFMTAFPWLTTKYIIIYSVSFQQLSSVKYCR